MLILLYMCPYMCHVTILWLQPLYPFSMALCVLRATMSCIHTLCTVHPLLCVLVLWLSVARSLPCLLWFTLIWPCRPADLVVSLLCLCCVYIVPVVIVDLIPIPHTCTCCILSWLLLHHNGLHTQACSQPYLYIYIHIYVYIFIYF